MGLLVGMCFADRLAFCCQLEWTLQAFQATGQHVTS